MHRIGKRTVLSSTAFIDHSFTQTSSVRELFSPVDESIFVRCILLQLLVPFPNFIHPGQ
jgi:hypothetical protein